MGLITRDFYFDSGENKLAASVDYVDDTLPPPSVLSLHGAGPHNRQLISYLSPVFNKGGRSLLRFDFSGHKDSTGLLEDSSISKRMKEALIASTFLDQTSNDVVLIGTSMGGHIALEILPHLPVSKLILFCPAAYSSKAHSVAFGKGFTEIIREKNSFLSANVFLNLEFFRGDTMLIIGEDDQIIPREVFDLYISSSKNCRSVHILKIPNAPHSIHVWLQKNDIEREKLIREVEKFLKL